MAIKSRPDTISAFWDAKLSILISFRYDCLDRRIGNQTLAIFISYLIDNGDDGGCAGAGAMSTIDHN